jgi:hypothetical protein
VSVTAATVSWAASRAQDWIRSYSPAAP